MLPPSLTTALQALSKALINIQPKPITRQPDNNRGVTIVPLPAASLARQPPQSSAEKSHFRTTNPPMKVNLNVKVINPAKKSQCQTFVLRGVSGSTITTPMHLKKEILKQFGSELVPGDLDFPIGYTKSGTKVWIRTDSDVADVWSFLRNNEAVSLWCHGVSEVSKHQKGYSSASDSDSDDSRSYKKKSKRKKKKLSAYDEKMNKVE